MYITVGEVQEQFIYASVSYKPFVRFIWLGGFLMAFGVLFKTLFHQNIWYYKCIKKIISLKYSSSFHFFYYFLRRWGTGFRKNNDGSLSKSIMEIAIELKCLECEGQNVYESNSNFSQSIKAYIRKELTRGTIL